MGELGRYHRVFIDSSRPEGGMEAMHYARGILGSHRNDYGGASEDYGMIVCFRRFSTMLGYNDVVWEKYGQAFKDRMDVTDPQTGEAFKVNPVSIEGRMDMPNLGATVDRLAEEGMKPLKIAETLSIGKSSVYRILDEAKVPETN